MNRQAQELHDWMRSQGFNAWQLDDEIHEIFSNKASDINNEGLLAQAEALVSACGVEEAKKRLCELFCINVDGFIVVKPTFRIVIKVPSDGRSSLTLAQEAMQGLDYSFIGGELQSGGAFDIVETEMIEDGTGDIT